ncbi:nuclear mRNA export, poly(A)+RNA binding protein [Entomophthora muscae]|uniref:Nuclear mRNA export, poly(A)+RNA binding protein n=1 Tax=Entomophthora muscae TaxID=34485 RepID=A0ACC2RKG4_9FUNG|nr:nuclear mRNA export, poly(A)+RNA binding protein [Entomophthora muscae]
MSTRNVNSGHWRGRGRGGQRQNRGGSGRNFERTDINSRLGYSNNSYNRFDDEEMSRSNSQNRGSNPYGRGRNTRNSSRPHDTVSNDPAVSVLGVRGGHIGALLSFLEGSCNSDLEIVESKQHNDEVVITVKTYGMAKALVNLSGISFSGSKLIIRHKNSHLKGPRNENKTVQLEAIKSFLQRRYDSSQRLLDLSRMDADGDLMEAKVQGFCSLSLKSNLPAVFFKLAQSLNIDPVTVVLSYNRLKDLSFLSTLGTYLPNVANISFESNNLVSYSSITPLAECKNIKIEGLIFNDNPFKDMDIRKNGDEINYRTKISDMFPNLKVLDGSPVQAAMQFGVEQEVVSSLMDLPRKIAPSFCDNDITRNATFDFLGKFFDLYDNDRNTLINYYDTSALFSITVNADYEDMRKGTGKWQDYHGVDRNLKRYTELTVRSARLHIGGETIIKFINTLPKTDHPTTQQERFCFDAWQPDCMIPLGSSTPTMGAYIHITIHGEFTDVRSNSRRAFDRTFILSTPTEGSRSQMAGLPYTIISDALTLRAVPAIAAWMAASSDAPPPQQYTMPAPQPTPQMLAPQPTAQASIQMAPQPIPSTSLTILPDQQSLVQALQQRTNLTAEFALQCLQEMHWNLDVASNAVQQLHSAGQLPPEAFMPSQ